MNPTKQLLRKRFNDLYVPELKGSSDPLSSESNKMGDHFLSRLDDTTNPTFSLHDQVTLLLSVADIVRNEISAFPMVLQDNDDMSETKDYFETGYADDVVNLNVSANSFPERRSEVGFNSSTRMSNLILDTPVNRTRTVSIDSPLFNSRKVGTEVMRACSPTEFQEQKMVTPVSSPEIRGRRPLRKPALHVTHGIPNATSGSEESGSASVLESQESTIMTPRHNASNRKRLQGDSPKGTRIRKIVRRKFSWKNYPEVRFYSQEGKERSMIAHSPFVSC